MVAQHAVSEKKMENSLDVEAGLAPMSPLSVVADGVAGPETDPLGDRAVLLLRLGELLLRAERLVARHLD